MKTRAAVALEKGKPLTVTDVELDGPKASEVLVEIKATGICHTDEFTLSGADPEGLFPSILGHEGAGIVVDIGLGVTSVKKAITLFRFTRPNAEIVRPVCHARPICAPPFARHRARASCLTGPRASRSAVTKFITTWAARHSPISPSCRKSR